MTLDILFIGFEEGDSQENSICTNPFLCESQKVEEISDESALFRSLLSHTLARKLYDKI